MKKIVLSLIVFLSTQAQASSKYCHDLLEMTEPAANSFYNKAWKLTETGEFKKVSELAKVSEYKKRAYKRVEVNFDTRPFYIKECIVNKKNNKDVECITTKISFDSENRVSGVASDNGVSYDLKYGNGICYIAEYKDKSDPEKSISYHLDLCRDIHRFEAEGVIKKNNAFPPTVEIDRSNKADRLAKCKDRKWQREAQLLFEKYKIPYPKFSEEYAASCSKNGGEDTPLGKLVDAYAFCYTVFGGFNKDILSDNKLWNNPTHLSVAPVSPLSTIKK